jgi:hypothetical protein
VLGVALAMAGAGVCMWDSGRSGGGGGLMPPEVGLCRLNQVDT